MKVRYLRPAPLRTGVKIRRQDLREGEASIHINGLLYMRHNNRLYCKGLRNSVWTPSISQPWNSHKTSDCTIVEIIDYEGNLPTERYPRTFR